LRLLPARSTARRVWGIPVEVHAGHLELVQGGDGPVEPPGVSWPYQYFGQRERAHSEGFALDAKQQCRRPVVMSVGGVHVKVM
jgi:hypothetical protein